jgi:hypothetical protein
MFSSAAHGSHVFRPTAATTTAPNKAEDDSTTAVDPPASSFLPATSSFLSTTAMDVDAIANYPPPHSQFHFSYVDEYELVSAQHCVRNGCQEWVFEFQGECGEIQ